MGSDISRTCSANFKGLGGGALFYAFKKCNVMLKSVLGAFLLCQVKRSSPRDLLELLSFAGACAGSVSREVCLARGMLQGGDPSLCEQHSQKPAVDWDASLGALLRPWRWD